MTPMTVRSTKIFAELPLVLFFACTIVGKANSNDVNVAETRPNILFVIADDLGFNQLGCYGNTPIRTPNLDRLASGGIRFTQAYAGNTVCSPSRVSLFTGRDGRLMDNNSNTAQLREIDVTLAHVLKRAGYDTALFGKYSIGSQMGVTDPLAMGFDTWFGMYSILEGHRQYPDMLWRDGKKLRIKANEGGRKGSYAQELFTARSDQIYQPAARPSILCHARVFVAACRAGRTATICRPI